MLDQNCTSGYKVNILAPIHFQKNSTLNMKVPVIIFVLGAATVINAYPGLIDDHSLGQLNIGDYGGHGGHQLEIYADHHPKYAYKYGVADHHTGDHKEANEERDGDVVHGEYSLLQPDGRKRTVHYTASHHGGFNAHVSYSGHAVHPEQHISHQVDLHHHL